MNIRELRAEDLAALLGLYTHLPNRLLLADRMTQAFALSDRTQTQAAVCY